MDDELLVVAGVDEDLAVEFEDADRGVPEAFRGGAAYGDLVCVPQAGELLAQAAEFGDEGGGLTYNPTNGKNCVTTIRNTPGTATDMAAWIYVPDTDAYDQDYGTYTSYAGPTHTYGKNHCVDWGGQIHNIYVQITGSNCASLKEQRVTTVR